MSKRRKRLLAKTIFIACEGRNSEPIYFERIKEEIEEQGLYALTIYPDKNEDKPKSDALGLVMEARNRSDEFDEVWAVFDKNGYTLHDKVFKEANKIINGKKVNIGFSSIAFEHWILLHFERNLTPFKKSECKDTKGKITYCGTSQHANDCMGKRCIGGYLRTKNYFPNYSKTAINDTYTFLKNRTGNAIANTAWLRKEKAQDLLKAKNKPFDLNPYCTLDHLVAKLLSYPASIIVTNIGEVVETDNWIFQFFNDASTYKNSYSVALTNKTSKAEIIRTSQFELTSKEVAISLKTIEPTLILPNEEKILSLFSMPSGTDRKLVFSWNNTQIFCFFN